MATKVALIRHGHAESNIFSPEKRVGNTEAALTKLGHEQLLAAGSILGSLVTVQEVYSSELLRARQSAQVVASLLDIDKIITDSRLNEVYKGAWEGLTVEEVMVYEAEIEENERYRHRPPGGGENLPILARRVVPAIIEKAKKAEKVGHDVVIFSHNHPIRAGVGYILDRPVTTWENLMVDNASITLLQKDRFGWKFGGTY